MKTKYYFLAALAAMFASCANDEYIGDTSPTALEQTGGDGSIRFGFDFQNIHFPKSESEQVEFSMIWCSRLTF